MTVWSTTLTIRWVAVTGCATRMRWTISLEKPPKSCCSLNIGAAPGVGSRMAQWRCGRSAECKSNEPGLPQTSPAFTYCIRCFKPRLSSRRLSVTTNTMQRILSLMTVAVRALRQLKYVADKCADSKRVLSSLPVAVRDVCFRLRPMGRLRPEMAWRLHTAPALRSRTWSSSNTTRRDCQTPVPC